MREIRTAALFEDELNSNWQIVQINHLSGKALKIEAENFNRLQLCG